MTSKQNLRQTSSSFWPKTIIPPIDRDEVYKEIFEQAENFKKYKKGV